MRYIRLCGTPEIKFAHIFDAPSYNHVLPATEHKIEISYVSAGKTLREQGWERVESKPFAVNCNLFEAPANLTADGYHEHRTVCFSVPFEVLEEGTDCAFCLPFHLPLTSREKIHDLIDEIIRLYMLEPEKKWGLTGLFLQVLEEYSHIARRFYDKDFPAYSPYVNRAKEYICRNLQRPISEKEVAAYLGITPEYLCAVFKRANDMSLITYVNQAKLARIRTEMECENLRLYEAAARYGYNDPNYVSRLYKRYFGKNITDFKKES